MSNSRVNHRIEILSYGGSKDNQSNTLCFKKYYLVCQRYCHTSNTLYTCPTKIMILTILFVSQHINKLLKMYCIKRFSIASTLFYVKNLRTDDFFYKIVHSQVFCTKPQNTPGVSDRSILLLKCSKKTNVGAIGNIFMLIS